jgi:hypothetical protein
MWQTICGLLLNVSGDRGEDVKAFELLQRSDVLRLVNSTSDRDVKIPMTIVSKRRFFSLNPTYGRTSARFSGCFVI